MDKQPVKQYDLIVAFLNRSGVSFVADSVEVSILNHLAVIPVTTLDDAIALVYSK